MKGFLARPAAVLATAWLATCCAAVLAGMTLRLSPVEQQMLQPGFLAGLLTPLALTTAAVAAFLLWVAASHARALRLQGALAEMILFFPLVFAYIWLVMPARELRPADGAVLVLALATAVWLLRRPTLERPADHQSRAQNLPVDLALILVPVLLGTLLGVRPDWKASGVSALLYPVYALIQLGVFLVIPARRLRSFGLSDRGTALFCAAVFALLHAPNPVVAGAVFLAMFVWVGQYLRGRPAWQLAVVMGLSATTFSQFLSDDVTGHMRVGPGYLLERATDHLAGGSHPANRQPVEQFLATIYPACLDRKPTEQELELWQEVVDNARRTTMAWQFFTSEEYARLATEQGWDAPPPEAVHWTRYDDPWRQRVLDFGTDAYWNRCGGNFSGFTRCLYRDILKREASGAEVAAWNAGLTRGQRKRLATILLERAPQWRNAPFPGLTPAELVFPR